MTRSRACWWLRSDERAPRYVAGTLPEAEVEALEAHLLECEACQREVHQAVALHVAAVPTRHRRVPAAAVLLAAAAAVAAIALLRPADPVTALGAIGGELPTFEGMAVRSRNGVRTTADSGMDAYAAGRLRAAAALLARASAEEPTPGLHFFLGVSRLALGDHGGATLALGSALAPAGNPYEVEARLYLAKARLSAGDSEGALRALAPIPESDGTPAGRHARALADSVHRVRGSGR